METNTKSLADSLSLFLHENHEGWCFYADWSIAKEWVDGNILPLLNTLNNAHIEPELWERVKTALDNISANAKSYKFASEIQKTAKLEHIRLKAEAILKEID